MIQDYIKYYGKEEEIRKEVKAPLSDYDLVKDKVKFIEDEAVDHSSKESNWEKRAAKKYYDQLHKEYALTDLSAANLKENAIPLRWRVHKEVLDGKGQFSCGNIKCNSKTGLISWELPFQYEELEEQSQSLEQKIALVKVRLCSACSELMKSLKITNDYDEQEESEEMQQQEDGKKDLDVNSSQDTYQKLRHAMKRNEEVSSKASISESSATYKNPQKSPKQDNKKRTRDIQFDEYDAFFQKLKRAE